MARINSKISYRIAALLLSVGIGWWILDESTLHLERGETALVFRLGEIQRVLEEPGSYQVIPVLENFRVIRNIRVLKIPVAVGGTQSLSVRIVDPRQYFVVYNTDDKIFESRLFQLLQTHERSGGSLDSFIRKFNDGAFGDSGVRLEIEAPLN